MGKETVWQFDTKHFSVKLLVEQEDRYQYDGDDEDGEIQRKIDCGEYIAFQSAVIVEHDGEEIAADYLGGSVYDWRTVPEFWTAHRGRDPMDRNCSIMRAARGANVCICHYFPGMVAEAVAEARKRLHKGE